MDYKKLNDLIKSSDNIKLKEMSMYQIDSEDQFDRNYYELVMSMEGLMNRARASVINNTKIDKREYLNAAAKEIGISVNPAPNGVAITLPYLLPKRKSVRSDSYIIEPLACALKEYTEHYKSKKLNQALITITSVYTPENKKPIRDLDNIELRRVINTISTDLLVDDDTMELYIRNRIGDSVHTEIVVSEAAKTIDCE